MLRASESARAQGKTDRAIELVEGARALLPASTLIRDVYARLLESAQDAARLTDLALEDLKRANDVEGRVAAYEQLARIDAELRGDADSALVGLGTIVGVDATDRIVVRKLESAYLAAGKTQELAELYAQVSQATPDLEEGARLAREVVRIRSRSDAHSETLDEDIRRVLAKDPSAVDALVQLLGRARARGDVMQAVDLWRRLGDAVKDLRPVAAAVCATRAAALLSELGRDDEAEVELERAVRLSDVHAPALVEQLDRALEAERWDAAARAAEGLSLALATPARRIEAAWISAQLSREKLDDPARARGVRACAFGRPQEHRRLRALARSSEHDGRRRRAR